MLLGKGAVMKETKVYVDEMKQSQLFPKWKVLITIFASGRN